MTTILSPAETYLKLSEISKSKSRSTVIKTFLLSCLAGIYISYGCVLAISVGGQLPSLDKGLQKLLFGAFGLPFGLTLVMVTGAELFTGNTLVMTIGVLEKEVKISALLKNWIISYIGNITGSAVLIGLVKLSDIFDDQTIASDFVKSLAVAKTTKGFGIAFTRGILCNWLVCLAVWQATASKTFIDKTFGIFWPIMAFVAIGFEHSVANMFLVPIGLLADGNAVTFWSFLWKNLLPVTLGNIFAGSICVALVYAICLGRFSEKIKNFQF